MEDIVVSGEVNSEEVKMSIKSYSFEVKTTADTDILDITSKVETLVGGSKVTNGLVTIFTPGSTAGLSTIEYESGVIEDLKRTIEEMVPKERVYQHDERWGDGNGYSHVRAALLKPSLTVPLEDGRMILGTWQQIVLLDFDNRPRSRSIVVQVMGA